MTMTNQTHIPTDADVVHAMRQHGGAFIKKLAEAWLAADPVNQFRLSTAFAMEFGNYRQAARIQVMNDQLGREDLEAKIRTAAEVGFELVAGDPRRAELAAAGMGRN
jgi:hypothetical protein